MEHSSDGPKPFLPVKPEVNLPKLEEEILQFWEQRHIFEKSLNKGASKPYGFYDGPPFATGLPHYGHILAGVLKDIVPRYWTMKGYSVPRRFGWDCHGLPVEQEINKTLKIDSSKQVLELGVDKYNAACRGIVQRYSQEWKRTVRRVGRWVDMGNAYFTMNVSFMQSVWWVFQQLYKQGLIYEGHKVVPYSVGVSTPLSNFEAGLNYKDVQDPAITVSFAVIGEPEAAFLAWTTTPWTLPSNLALAVSRDIDYVRVRHKTSGKIYILAQALLTPTFKTVEELEVLATFKGSELIGMKYEPLFPYFTAKVPNGFRVIQSDHVTTESGTGIVHMAPAFGEEDYYACIKEGLPVVNPVDDDGMFTSEVPDYQGRRVKDADKDIMADLKRRGRLFKHDTIVHSYPFCWRTDTPLIYRAVSSWFVAVEKIKDHLLKSNQTTQWVPEMLRDGRFGNWLENARDWAISRNRFWGAPIPIWRNKEGEIMCIGSKAELEQLSGRTVEDLHMEFVDPIEIPSPTGKRPLRRIPHVLDCWFESGSMPYAQWGYPFDNREQFEKNFPADFIAEGLDQTRGWFYTLMVIGTALFDKAPFRNVVVNGIILAENGEKMSKRLRNYPDPNAVMDAHGADALRLYLINSPVVKAQELRFSEKGVRDVVRQILLRWWNSYSFFVNYANVDDFRPRGDYASTPNVLDKWVLSRLNHLIQNTVSEMEAYRLFNVVPALLLFIEDLTNTYIRFNRRHFWQEGMPEDKRLAYETLHHVLLTLSKAMAPFAPFLAEVTYQNLSRTAPNACESVHLEAFPEPMPQFIHLEMEEAVQVMDALVMLGRNLRERIQVKAKIPLKSMRIIHRDPRVLENLKPFRPYFQDELNIRHVDYDSREDEFIQVTAKANFPVLGKRLGPKMKAVAAAIQKLGIPEIVRLEKGETLAIQEETVTLADVEIRRSSKGAHPHLLTSQMVSIEVDPTVDREQLLEGLAREVIRKVQQARKNADFVLDDRIRLELSCANELAEAVRAHQNMVQRETLAMEFHLTDTPKGKHVETVALDEGPVRIGVTPLARNQPRAGH